MPVVFGMNIRLQPAGTRSGIAFSSELNTASISASFSDVVQSVVGAGGNGLTTSPGGATTCTGRFAPSTRGIVGSMHTYSPTQVAETVFAYGEFR